MSTFAILVLAILILLALLYILVALYSFGIKLPKWLRLTIWIILIVFVVDGFIGLAVMNRFPIATIIYYVLTLILWIYMLINWTKLPKRLKITIWVFAVILAVLTGISCFIAPALYGDTTISSFINTYSTLQ